MNFSKYKIRPEAQRDLEEHGRYLAREAGADVAMHFTDSARASFAAIGDVPNIGVQLHSRNPAFEELRKWRISGFAGYLIFYRSLAEGADVLRVLHGAQDWWAALDIASDCE